MVPRRQESRKIRKTGLAVSCPLGWGNALGETRLLNQESVGCEPVLTSFCQEGFAANTAHLHSAWQARVSAREWLERWMLMKRKPPSQSFVAQLTGPWSQKDLLFTVM